MVENEKLKIYFDKNTHLVERLIDKQKGRELKMKMELVRYMAAHGESGAYIMAYNMPARNIKLQLIKTVIQRGYHSTQVINFYKSPFKSSCFCFVIMQLDNHDLVSEVLKISIKTFHFDNEEVYLRFRTNLDETKLITHNSVYHLDTTTLTKGKREFSYRDIGVHYFPSTVLSALRYD